MGLDVAVVNLRYLERPAGITYNFAAELAAECDTSGGGNAFGFYLRSELLHSAAHYIQQNDVDMNVQTEILNWVESLPFDDSGYVTLNFNW